jgi:hypothetical protein
VRGLAAVFISLATGSFAVADPGDSEKAKEMLARVVVVVQRDRDAAMQKFNAGTDGFKDGNIYPFCFRLSGGVVITGRTAGSDIRKFPGSGQQIFEAAQKPEGEITEITSLAKKPPPAESTPVKKSQCSTQDRTDRVRGWILSVMAPHTLGAVRRPSPHMML